MFKQYLNFHFILAERSPLEAGPVIKYFAQMFENYHQIATVGSEFYKSSRVILSYFVLPKSEEIHLHEIKMIRII